MRGDDLELYGSGGSETPLERADRLFELAMNLDRDGDRLSAAAAYAEAADCYARVGYPERQAEALVLRGSSLYTADHFEESAESHLQAVEVARAIPDWRTFYRASWAAADALSRLNDWSSALTHVEASLKVGRTYAFDDLEASGEFIRGKALYWLDREEESLTALAFARDLFRAQRASRQVSAVDDFSITVFLFLGRTTEATEAARRCLSFWQGMDDEVEVAFSHRRLGECLAQARDLQPAITHFEASKRLFLKHRWTAAAAISDLGVARALRDLHRLDEAITTFTGAIAILEASGYDDDRRGAQDELSLVLCREGRYEESIAIDRTLIAECGFDPEFDSGLVNVVDRCMWSHLRRGEAAAASSLFEQVAPAVAWTREGPSNAWFRLRSMYGWALWLQGADDAAFTIVGELIDHPAMSNVGVNQARVLEMAGYVDDEELSFKCRARAMAMYLEVGYHESAKLLAEHVLRQSE